MLNKQHLRFPMLAVMIIGLSVSIADAQGRKTPLENFNGDRYVDTAIWSPTSAGWGYGIQQVNREIRRNALNLSIGSTSLVNSPDQSNGGNEFYRRNRLLISPQSITGIKGLEADIKVNSSRISGCPLPGSGDTEATKSRARAMIQSAAFNDGSSTGEGDFSGEYFVEIALEKSDKTRGAANFVDISVGIIRADNSDVSESTEILRKVIGRARHGERVRLSYRWDLTRKFIRFKALNLTRRSTRNFLYRFNATVPGPVVSPNSAYWGNIQSRTILPRCRPASGTVRRPSAMIDADFDNIAWYR